MFARIIFVSALFAASSSAQWFDIKVAGTPRLPNGRPNLSAPVPRDSKGKPILDGIERPVNKDSNSRQTAYETGGLDFVDVERPELQRIQSDPVLSKELKQFDRANIYYLALNQQAFAPFKDRRVRQAFR